MDCYREFRRGQADDERRTEESEDLFADFDDQNEIEIPDGEKMLSH